MAYIDTNNIEYTSFDGDIFTRGKKVSNEQYLGVSVDDLTSIADDNGGKLPTIINAVEIDWNGAKPGIGEGENGITTTGELLSSIKGVYSPMFAS